MLHRTGEAVGRKPFGKSSGVGEGAVDFVGGGAEDAVEFYGSCWHGGSPLRIEKDI